MIDRHYSNNRHVGNRYVNRIGIVILAILASSLLKVVEGSFTLITFDVGGTLVHGSGEAADTSAHSRVFGLAVGKVLGGGPATELVSKVFPRRDFHGSTDGLILLRLARAALGVEPSEASEKLDEMMDTMYSHFQGLDDESVSRGISALPGVLSTLRELSSRYSKDQVACGLVTGNVEGIARRKMHSVGVWQTGALAEMSVEQQQNNGRCPGAQDIGFLGGFGSDFCSGNIDDPDRNFLDRSEQIAIASRLTKNSHPNLKRVVHVGDAPADVLAAKAFAEYALDEYGVCVGSVAVATGSYSAQELTELAGKPIPGRWEPVILEDGMADPNFIEACGIQ